jgi:dTMP kinase
MPGLFISLDGIDGTGKSTQCRLLADWLRSQGRTVTQCTDPGGTALGQAIREILLGSHHTMTVTCQALLFMASRAQLVAEVIRPALAAGHVVISDRFLLANVVYQGHAGGLDPAWLKEVGRVAADGIEPDLAIVLDLPVEVAQARRGAARDRFESQDQSPVRNGFLAEARLRPERIRVIDAAADVQTVHQWIVKEVAGVLAARERA